jgi:hypothetical protein
MLDILFIFSNENPEQGFLQRDERHTRSIGIPNEEMCVTLLELGHQTCGVSP